MPREKTKSEEVLNALLTINTQILLEADRVRILEHIAESAMKVFNANSCKIHQHDPTSHSFLSEASVGLGKQWVHSPRPKGLGKKVLNTGHHIWEDNAEKLNPIVQKAGIRSAGVFPLQPEGGKPVGILYLHFIKNPHFSQDEINLVYHFSYNAGLAIQQTEHIRDLEALRNASIEVAKAGTLKESLKRVVHSATEILHADAAILYPWNGKERTIDKDLVVGTGLDLDNHLLLPRPHGLTHTLIKQGTLSVEDIDKVSYDQIDLVRNLKEYVMSANQLRSFIGIALSSTDDQVGVLYVFFRTPHKPSNEEISTLDIFAEMAATRIQLAKLSEAQEKAALAEAVTILSAGAAQFAHRLANVAGTVPLIIRDITRRLKAAGIVDDEIYTRLEDLSEDTQGLMDMADQLTLQDAGKPVSVDLASVVERAIKAARLKDINSTIEVRSALHQETIRVSAVEVLLKDIVVNLLQNAAEANATSVEIRTVDHPKAGMIDLHVIDDGSGISKSDAQKVFMPLFSTKEEGTRAKARGIGLWASRYQIGLMDGAISVESTLGEGSTFTISLKKP